MAPWVLIGWALAACTSPADAPPPSEPASDTVTTRPDTGDFSSAESDNLPEPSPERTATESEPGVSECEEPGGWLAVTGDDGKVTVIRADGTSVRQLRGPVRPGHPGLQPTWSPGCDNGARFVVWTEVTDDRSFAIAQGDAVSGEVQRFSAPLAAFYYNWSPDGQRVAFLGQNAFSPLQMGILDLETANTETIDEGQPFYFDWRPDSQAIAAHIGDALVLLTHSNGSWSPLRLSLRPGLFQAPAWIGPDRILSVVPDSGGPVEVNLSVPNAQGNPPPGRLVISDQTGTAVTNVADVEGPTVFAPDPSGTRVALRDFAGPLRVVNLEEGTTVALSEQTVAAFQWSPDGSHLLYMEVDTDAKALAPRVWDRTQVTEFPSFTPTRVFVLQYLPFWDQYSRSLTLWSPRSDGFTYPAVTSDGDRIMVQHLNDPHPTEIAEGVFASWSPAGPKAKS